MTTFEQNLITEGTINDGVIFEVRVPLSATIIGNGYPIRYEDGSLCSLNEGEVGTYFGEYMESVLVRVNGKEYLTPARVYYFEVNDDEISSHINLELTFKAHAKDKQDAIKKVSQLVSKLDKSSLKFGIHNYSLEENYTVSVLDFTVLSTRTFKAEEVIIQHLDTSDEHLKTLNAKQLIDLFVEVNDVLMQNAYEGQEFVEEMTQAEFDIIWELARKLGYR